MNDNTFYIIDFDSTFIKVEALEVLAGVALKNNRSKHKILQEIKLITQQGMEGKMPYHDGLIKRLQLIDASKKHIDETIVLLKKNISNSFLKNKDFIKKNAERIYFVSGGFDDLIWPVIKEFGISKNHVFTNTFVYDGASIVGCDVDNPLAYNDGKVKVARALGLKGHIIAIGDGYTDYEIKKNKIAQTFIAYTEHAKRDVVIANADYVVNSFDEVITQISKKKVLLLEKIDTVAADLFVKAGYEVVYEEASLNEDDLIRRLWDVEILGIRSRTHITKKVLNSAPKLKAIGAFCIGLDQVDLDFARTKGVAVFNAPFSNTRSVVELVIAEMIFLIRGVIEKNNKLHAGIWDKSASGSYEIRGKKLGIIGYGNIGMQVSVVAESLGMDVYYFDTVEKQNFGNAQKCTSIGELLSISDIVTVHVDGNKSNHHLIAEQEFKLMKDGAFFINASRGFVVDLKALSKYLKLGKIKGAAIDVFPNEPKSKKEIFASELQGMTNVILTPHIGGSTEEAQREIALFVSKKLINFMHLKQ